MSNEPLPPHARGCTRVRAARAGRADASPARAGMYLRGVVRSHRPGGFPRTRGDVPSPDAAEVSSAVLPPHARGCTRNRGQAQGGHVASPARAGMYPDLRPHDLPRRRFPRTRGDVPAAPEMRPALVQLPPHARGCTYSPPRARLQPLASPARAGMYLSGVGGGGWRCGFPRTRGDVPRWWARGWRRETLPPHARGCT